jgi:type II secretory pathway component GspD/PulD (secretin)
MIGRISVVTILYALLVTVCLCSCPAGVQAEQSEANSLVGDVTIGKENPFAILASPEVSPILQEIVKEQEAVKEAAVPEAPLLPAEPNAPELFVEATTLKYLDAKSLMSVLESISSEYGRISINEGTNSLIVCDTKGVLDKIIVEIKKADRVPQQMMIEVAIIDVQLNDDTEIGIDWDLLSAESYDYAFRQSLDFTPRLLSTIGGNNAISNPTTDFVTYNGPASDFSIISGTVRNVIHMLQEKKNLEIIASPRVMVLSGQTASIEAGEEIPYNEIQQYSNGGALQKTSFKNVGVKLEVSATLTDDDFINISVIAEQKVATGMSYTGVPVVDARIAKTALFLEDGQIIILGGLRRKEISERDRQVPILGNIPILGLLFKSTKTVETNSELIILISPHIYQGEPIPEDVMEKFTKIKKNPTLTIPPPSIVSDSPSQQADAPPPYIVANSPLEWPRPNTPLPPLRVRDTSLSETTDVHAR